MRACAYRNLKLPVKSTPSLHVPEQVLDALVRLLAGGQDLGRRQDEPVAAGVTELHGEDVVCLGHIIDVVHAGAGRRVNGRAYGPIGVLRAVQRGDGLGGTAGQRLQLVVVGGGGGAAVPVRRHEQLRVRVPVDVELDALRALDRVDLVPKRLVLRGVASSKALEVLSAGVCRGTAGDVPLVGPVAVDVVTKAAAARGRLPVLAPQAVGLRVDETCDILATNPQARLEGCAGIN